MTSFKPPFVKEARGRGRPREFDVATALDGAVRIFRERGYNATSVTDLTKATGLVAGSLYKAFKDKRGIFLAAFDRYVEERDAMRHLALRDAGNGREKLKELLGLYAAASSGPEGKRGCLVAGSAIELATLDAGTVRRVRATYARNERLLVRTIRDGQQDGSINADIDSEAAARLMLC
ncbi:MAG: TetR/AcrR family transcriptional regulator, partial [Burkholderiales bacterium]